MKLRDDDFFHSKLFMTDCNDQDETYRCIEFWQDQFIYVEQLTQGGLGEWEKQLVEMFSRALQSLSENNVDGKHSQSQGTHEQERGSGSVKIVTNEELADVTIQMGSTTEQSHDSKLGSRPKPIAIRIEGQEESRNRTTVCEDRKTDLSASDAILQGEYNFPSSYSRRKKSKETPLETVDILQWRGAVNFFRWQRQEELEHPNKWRTNFFQWYKRGKEVENFTETVPRRLGVRPRHHGTFAGHPLKIVRHKSLVKARPTEQLCGSAAAFAKGTQEEPQSTAVDSASTCSREDVISVFVVPEKANSGTLCPVPQPLDLPDSPSSKDPKVETQEITDHADPEEVKDQDFPRLFQDLIAEESVRKVDCGKPACPGIVQEETNPEEETDHNTTRQSAEQKDEDILKSMWNRLENAQGVLTNGIESFGKDLRRLQSWALDLQDFGDHPRNAQDSSQNIETLPVPFLVGSSAREYSGKCPHTDESVHEDQESPGDCGFSAPEKGKGRNKRKHWSKRSKSTSRGEEETSNDSTTGSRHHYTHKSIQTEAQSALAGLIPLPPGAQPLLSLIMDAEFNVLEVSR